MTIISSGKFTGFGNNLGYFLVLFDRENNWEAGPEDHVVWSCCWDFVMGEQTMSLDHFQGYAIETLWFEFGLSLDVR